MQSISTWLLPLCWFTGSRHGLGVSGSGVEFGEEMLFAMEFEYSLMSWRLGNLLECQLAADLL